MSTLLTPRPPAVRDRFRVAARQESLFGDDPGARPGAAPAPHPPAAPRREAAPEEPKAAATLDTAISSLWETLAAGELATCPVCDSPMEPRHSSGSAVVGGRCRSCGSTLA